MLPGEVPAWEGFVEAPETMRCQMEACGGWEEKKRVQVFG